MILILTIKICIFLQKLMSTTNVRKIFVRKHIKRGHSVIDVGSEPFLILNDLPKINYYRYAINRSYTNHV